VADLRSPDCGMLPRQGVRVCLARASLRADNRRSYEDNETTHHKKRSPHRRPFEELFAFCAVNGANSPRFRA
jgi:hypothetical protein